MSDEYITSKQAQDRLHRSERQIRNYAASGRVRTQRRVGRVLYHVNDINQLVEELRPEAPPPQSDILPAGELFVHIRELETRLQQASAEIGYLRGILESKNSELADIQEVRRQLIDRETEAALMRQELQQASRNNFQRGQLILALSVIVVLAIIAITIFTVVR